ncbi:DUF5518 domain-containing protein [Salarchaeum sp. III]|uniref:DUF5518 domain-containing protein n=1 Tax=Salarchaeum sp. III TaxID=3107927 RepID=UPI002EDAAA9F
MEEHTDSDRAIVFDRLGDWVLGAVLWISGCVVALGGAALYYGVTRQGVADLIREGEFRSDVLTEAEAIDLITALSHWSGIGLLVSGASIILIGVAVVVVHRRARRDNRGTPAWILGVVGATVAAVLSFVPFSPVLGGAAAGYLDSTHDSRGISVGALAGVFGSLPLLIIGLFTSAGLFVSSPPEAVTAVAILLGIAVFMSLVYFVGLSALGGFVGKWVRKR